MVWVLGIALTCLLHILAAWLGVVGFPCAGSELPPQWGQGLVVLEEGGFLKEAASKVVDVVAQ